LQIFLRKLGSEQVFASRDEFGRLGHYRNISKIRKKPFSETRKIENFGKKHLTQGLTDGDKKWLYQPSILIYFGRPVIAHQILLLFKYVFLGIRPRFRNLRVRVKKNLGPIIFFFLMLSTCFSVPYILFCNS